MQTIQNRLQKQGWLTKLKVANLLAPLFFGFIVVMLYASYTDPDIRYAGDIGHHALSRVWFGNQHPTHALRGHPTPSYAMGSANYGDEGSPFSGVLFPVLPISLSWVAPHSFSALVSYEWYVTTLFLFACLLFTFRLARNRGLDVFLSSAISIAYAFMGTNFTGWRNLELFRGRLLVPLVLYSLEAAVRKETGRAWLLLGLSVVLCLSQSLANFWVLFLLLEIVLICLIGDSLQRSNRKGKWPVSPLLSLLLTAIIFLPAYLRVSAATAPSAFLASLRHAPDWLNYAYVLNSGTSSALFSVSHSGWSPLILGILALIIGNAALSSPPILTEQERKLRTVGLITFGTGLLFSVLHLVPSHCFFYVSSDNALRFKVNSLLVPSSLAMLLHRPVNSWVIMASAGLLLTTVSFLPAWIRTNYSVRLRLAQGAMGLFLLSSVFLLASFLISPKMDPIGSLTSLALCLIPIVACSLIATPLRSPAIGGTIVLLAFTVFWAKEVSSKNFATAFTEDVKHPVFRHSGRRLLNLHQAVIDKVPPEVKEQSLFRLATDRKGLDNVGFLLGSAALTSYPIRLLQNDVAALLIESGSVTLFNLPYNFELDYEKAHRYGLLDMLGVRYWIVGGPEYSFLKGHRKQIIEQKEGLLFFERTEAFPRGWAVEQWESVTTPQEARQKTLELGRLNQLRYRGVILETTEQAMEKSTFDAPESSKALVQVIDAQPGKLSFKVLATHPMILATNEVFSSQWRVLDNGINKTVLKTNSAFLGVFLTPGEHAVTFEHHSWRTD